MFTFKRFTERLPLYISLFFIMVVWLLHQSGTLGPYIDVPQGKRLGVHNHRVFYLLWHRHSGTRIVPQSPFTICMGDSGHILETPCPQGVLIVNQKKAHVIHNSGYRTCTLGCGSTDLGAYCDGILLIKVLSDFVVAVRFTCFNDQRVICLCCSSVMYWH